MGWLIGVSMATVKGRLHRARARLRRDVARCLIQGPASLPSGEEEVSMIEVTGDDIIVRSPKGEAATWTGPKGWLGKLGPLYVVLLKEAMGERILPM